MNGYGFTFAGAALQALPSGALYWPAHALLCVSDLHLGKSERMARRGAPALPPYETRDTLRRLQDDLALVDPATVVCLGDSFDDIDAAAGLRDSDRLWIARLQAGRRWIWIEGNHDPGPLTLGGSHLGELIQSPLVFRHIARDGARAEISGHYHPKASVTARGCRISRPCFLIDRDRVIMPAYGTYTGGLRSRSKVLCALMRPEAIAVVTGPAAVALPMPR